MTGKNRINTERLLIEPITVSDNDFIFELVNTDEWIQFIGRRNVNSPTDAIPYIEKIINNPKINYWVVKLKNDRESIGVITFIQRDYLEYPDIGFAFLKRFSGKGYAFEAVNAVLNDLVNTSNLSHILATTLPFNVNSIKLLNKLGLVFMKEIEVEKEKLHVYQLSTGLIEM